MSGSPALSQLMGIGINPGSFGGFGQQIMAAQPGPMGTLTNPNFSAINTPFQADLTSGAYGQSLGQAQNAWMQRQAGPQGGSLSQLGGQPSFPGGTAAQGYWPGGNPNLDFATSELGSISPLSTVPGGSLSSALRGPIGFPTGGRMY